MTARRKMIGQIGEEKASNYLKSLGYRIIGRNVRLSQGEIDIVAMEGKTVVFVEVRSRTGSREVIPKYGNPVESITLRKQQKLRQLALAYLQSHNQSYDAFRIDAIAVWICPDLSQTEVGLEHYKHI
ncbi:YraN family protein [Brevibacterium sp. JNUCC-42]|nr:YraN family protein [Brevibacterium sp. JNUCC-42]